MVSLAVAVVVLVIVVVFVFAVIAVFGHFLTFLLKNILCFSLFLLQYICDRFCSEHVCLCIVFCIVFCLVLLSLHVFCVLCREVAVVFCVAM